ncbi:MAG TPA: palindromic element RPE4 domain-containing protein [Rickettsia endosymbiont of Omalisus fontisbellaquei]|nr:palindromic element RPE4 domain-containing protein [Rickettsia endosymbiont of Omalisus fontisbellaquei]
MRGSISPLSSRDLFTGSSKNTNIISIFYYFLDTMVKPRYDTECFFISTQQC